MALDPILIPLGWDKTNHFLKVSFIEEDNLVRLNKVGNNNHNLQGPAISIDKIPELIEALIKIYNSERKK